MNAGDTFIIRQPGTSLDSHLWVLISDPLVDSQHVILINFTSWRADKDQACVLDVGDHPFVSRRTCELQKLADAGMIQTSAPISVELLKRIRDGVLNSSTCRLEIAAALARQGVVEEFEGRPSKCGTPQMNAVASCWPCIVFLAMLCAALLVGCGHSRADDKPAPVDFAKQIRPILSDHCFRCHGPKEQKNGLRLDRRDDAFKGGESNEPAIVPGNPDKSLAIIYIRGDDPDVMMPPEGDRVPKEKLDLLVRWIKEGASWPDEAPKKPEP